MNKPNEKHHVGSVDWDAAAEQAKPSPEHGFLQPGSEAAQQQATIQESILDPATVETQDTANTLMAAEPSHDEATIQPDSETETPADQPTKLFLEPPIPPPESVAAAHSANTQDSARNRPVYHLADAENAGSPIDSGVDLERERQAADAQVLAASRQRTRRSFLGAAAAVAAGFGVYRYLETAPRENMQPVPLEDAYKFNAALSRTIFRDEPLAPTYPLSRAERLRINGVYGLKKDIVPESWRLQLVGMANASQHPRFVPDVTTWDYQYMAPPANQDKGHDTKVDPGKEAAAQPVPASGPPSSNQESGGQGAPRGTAQSASEKRDPKFMSSAKMAPGSLLQREMKKEGSDDESSKKDDNHIGRKPRGMEEAGESDSTLPPHTQGLLLLLADITRLPRAELVTEFKCIEGWSQIVHWAGVRMADFLELYPPALIDGKEPRYLYMETPDGDYYTGYDLHVMRHPQTLLVTEMMGAPLTQNHGAPLRLHMPTKYGYKQIKRIGLIAYTNTKPDDYWTKLGYDWYAGL